MTTFQSIATFARVVRKWLDAIDAGDISEARFYADQVRAIALLVAVDPAYKEMYRRYSNDCDSDDAEQAARCVHAFVSAATEALIAGRCRGRE